MRKFILLLVLLCVWTGGSIYTWNTYIYPPRAEAYVVPVPRAVDIHAAITKRNPEIDPQVVSLVAATVQKNAEKYGIDPALIVAIMARESDFRMEAESRPNPKKPSLGYGVGIMQPNPVAHPDLFKDVPRPQWFHLEFNVDRGCRILSRYIKESSTIKSALNKYSGGHPEYTSDVLAHYGQMQWEAR
jgi:soluble lytic murein transglycosylase-like protein